MIIGSVALTGCENSKSNNVSIENEDNKKAIIVNNVGETENLTSEELYDISKSNEAKFKKYYVGAKICFDGTINSIETENRSCYDQTTYERWQSELKSTNGKSAYDKNGSVIINFNEGYKLIIPSVEILDVADINKGDKYYVESNIAYMWNNQVECFGIDSESEIFQHFLDFLRN